MIVVGITIDNTYNIKPIINTSRFIDPIGAFKKGIKRNPNLFPILDRETRWDNFNQALMIEIKA